MEVSSDNPQVQRFANLIRKELPCTPDIDEAVNNVRQSLEDFLPFTEEMVKNLDLAKRLIKQDLSSVRVYRKKSIFSTHLDWYTGTRAGDKHWPALAGYLADSKGWGDATVENITAQADEVVSLLANPAESKAQYRGLVVGYVQSGKTANMTAVIAKAVDMGYNFVVIMAGLTNKLRQQTQRRIESDLVDRHPYSWHLHTSLDYNGDFVIPNRRTFASPSQGVQLAVIKKNVSPLKRFLKTIELTPSVLLHELKVLIIDDECDSASVNSSSNERDMTAINENIRKIVSLLPFNAYVGYTATPFANVLINPYIRNNDLDDLYPRDFITALDQPDGYFGTEQLFGRDSENADDPDSDGLDMIRLVPDEDVTSLQPPSRNERSEFYPVMPESLETALLYFLATCASRLARGQTNQHMSMLIHTSIYTDMHDRVSQLVEAWIGKHKSDLLSCSGYAWQRLSAIWADEQIRIDATSFGNQVQSLEQLSEYLAIVLKNVQTPVENGFSDNRIDYSGDSKIYIVVGGTVLARGLTLEGLTVSYFLRTTTQYDTLLQMGRWFGYRTGYEDLPRIWMTEDLMLSFRALAGVEAEIREDIALYSTQNTNPMEMAVSIPAIPGMAITAANKMRHAVDCAVNYSGRHRQTIRFDRKNKELIRKNWNAGKDLLSICENSGFRKKDSNKTLYKDVPYNLVRKFFTEYVVHKDHSELSSEFILNYMDSAIESLEYWNIGLFQPDRGRGSENSLGVIGKPRLVQRTRLDTGGSALADIKGLMSARDVLFDCEEAPSADVINSWDSYKSWRQEREKNPLLLIYCIDKNSEPKKAGVRVAMDAEDDLLGFGIIFPGDRHKAGHRVSVSIDPLSADQLESLEEEEIESLGKEEP